MSTDKYLFLFVCTLMTISVIFSLSLSSYTVIYLGYNELHFFIRQFFFASASIFVMWSISLLNPDKYFLKIGLFLFLSSFFLMTIMPFLPKELTVTALGATRWLKIFGFSLAPVEFFKVGFVFFLAWSFNRKITDIKQTLKEELKVLLPYIGVFLVVVFLIAIMQKDLGQVIVLALTLAFMAIFAGTSWKLFSWILGGSFVVGIIAIISAEHRILRIKSWWSNIQDMVLSILPNNIASKLRVEDLPEPYQISHSLNAIKHGGITGQGFGGGLFKLGFLSEVHTDFVLSGIIEELGVLGIITILSLMLLIVFRISKIASRNENRIYYLFSVGIALVISFSFLMNAYGITSITPIKGIAVPFLSYGGSSMLALGIAMGMVLMVSKKAKLK